MTTRHGPVRAAAAASVSSGPTVHDSRDVALVDLLDRLLAGGVVIAGEIVLGVADVDLVRISLRALIASVRAAAPEPWTGADTAEPDGGWTREQR